MIEMDGDSHASQLDYDQVRTGWLANKGFLVIRTTDHYSPIKNLYTVVERQISPARRVVVGKTGWLGESG